MNERPMIAVPTDKLFILPHCFVSKNAGYNLNPGATKAAKSNAGDKWIRVFHRRHHSFNTSLDERFGAG
jgi:hypothetical protein